MNNRNALQSSISSAVRHELRNKSQNRLYYQMKDAFDQAFAGVIMQQYEDGLIESRHQVELITGVGYQHIEQWLNK